jgi:hypothetical protein
MIITLLIIVLFISFSIHIRYLVRYVIDKEKKYLHRYLGTSVINIIAAVSISVVVMLRPEYIARFDMKKLLWLMSGVIGVMMLVIQIAICRKIYQRCQLPEHFHYNFFGKKVLHPIAVKKYEVAVFFMTIPVFLLIGSYFIARLVNVILYKHL